MIEGFDRAAEEEAARKYLEEHCGEYYNFPVIQEALKLLREQLSPEYHYHSYLHTLEVMRDGITYCILDGVSKRETFLLAIAAAFHDIGFIQGPSLHEERGKDLVQRSMRRHGGFTDEECELVGQMILDTRVGPVTYWSNPSSFLSGYLMDADVSNLGKEDFYVKTKLLALELGADQESFLTQALKFLEGHRFFTFAAKQLRHQKKLSNIHALKGRLGEGEHLSLERLNYLSTLPRLLTPPGRLLLSIFQVLEYLKHELGALSAELCLGDGNHHILTFSVGKYATEVSSRRALFADSRQSNWVIVPAAQNNNKDSFISLSVAPFSRTKRAFLRAGVDKALEGSISSNVFFLERISEVLSLALSAGFSSIDEVTSSQKQFSISSLGQRLGLELKEVGGVRASLELIGFYNNLIKSYIYGSVVKVDEAFVGDNIYQVTISFSEPHIGNRTTVGLEGLIGNEHLKFLFDELKFGEDSAFATFIKSSPSDVVVVQLSFERYFQEAS